MLRVVIGASDFSSVHASLDDTPEPDPDLTHFSIERDQAEIIPVLREILEITPDLEIIASPWSAPGWMKDSGSYLFGTLRPEYEPAYAAYLARFVESYHAEGIPVGWLTVQNEPAAIQFTYPSMMMDAAQQARFVRDHLGPALADAGLGTRVLVWDHNWCDARPPGGCVGSGPAQFPLEVLAVTDGVPPVAGTAFHCYGGDQAAANEAVHAAWPGLQIWQTECSGGTWQGSRDAAFGQTVRLVLDGWNHWASARPLWNLALDPSHGPHLGGCDTCRGVVTVDPVTATWSAEPDLDVLATFAWAGGRGSRVLEASAAPLPDSPPPRSATPPVAPRRSCGTPVPPRRRRSDSDGPPSPSRWPARSLTASAPHPVRCDVGADAEPHRYDGFGAGTPPLVIAAGRAPAPAHGTESSSPGSTGPHQLRERHVREVPVRDGVHEQVGHLLRGRLPTVRRTVIVCI